MKESDNVAEANFTALDQKMQGKICNLRILA